MDGGRYSLTRYSVNRADKAVEVRERFSAGLGAVAGGAVPVEYRGRYGESVQGSARGTVSVVSGLAAQEGLSAAVSMSADVVVRAAPAGALFCAARGRKNVYTALNAQDGINARIWGAKLVPASLAAAGGLHTRAAASKDVLTALQGWETLSAAPEAGSQTVERAVFQLTIPPGGELRIDSGLFTVLLDGENALHAQEGDWISVSRELLRLTVECASGGPLQGHLIYTERYL